MKIMIISTNKKSYPDTIILILDQGEVVAHMKKRII